MPLPNEKVIGEQILTKIDQLIEVIIAATLKNKDDRQKLLEQGYVVTGELLRLLVQLLGPREDYLYTAVKELVRQRLPDQRLLNGFGDFYDLLEEIYQKALRIDETLGEEREKIQPVHERGPTNKIERALAFLFPRVRIFKNHWYKGVNFEYFLPFLKLAVEDINWDRSADCIRKEFLCRKYGIQLLRLDSKKASGYREMARMIKRRVPIRNP